MKKIILLYLSIATMALSLIACKNGTPGKTMGNAETTDLPAERNDSLVGFKGCDRAGFKANSPQVHEFKYQYHTVRVTQKETPGDIIEIILDSTEIVYKVPDVEETYFRGSSTSHFFVEVGVNSGTGDLIIYQLTNKALSQVFRSPYLMDEPPFVTYGSLLFYCPVEEQEVTKMPDCPDKASWLKKNLKIGYGQRYMYHMRNRGLTRKSEYVCVPLQ